MCADHKSDDIDSAIAMIDSIAPSGGNSDLESALSLIEAQVDQTIKALIEDIPEKEQKDLIELIRKRRVALPLSSSTRAEIVGICKQILAFGAAGVGLSIGFADKFSLAAPPVQKAVVIGGIFYLEIMVVSFFVILIYILQARFRYPFLYFDNIGNSWPFFYYPSISGDISRQPWQNRDQLFRGAKRYAQDFLRFSAKIAEESIPQQLRAEIQQYYLLIAYQGYSHQFSVRLANYFFYGFAGALLTLVVLIIWAVTS